MKQYKDIILSNKKMFENTLQCNLSNISNFYLTNCNINSISSLPLQTLNLSTNNLSKEGLEILSTLLSDFNTTITKLNLSDNYIAIYDYSHNLEAVDRFDFNGKKYGGWYKLRDQFDYIEVYDVLYWMLLSQPHHNK